MKKKTLGVAALSATMIAVATSFALAGHGPQAADPWRSRLSATDLDERERHFDALVRALPQDSALRTTVETWRDEGGELGWTARLALRSADRTHASPPRHPLGSGPFANPFRGFGDERFDGLLRDLEDLHSWLDDGALGAVPFGQPPQAGAPGLSSQSSQLSFQMNPDGVRVEILEDKDGDQSRRVYEAETLEELLQAHPDLRDRAELRGWTSDGGAFGRESPAHPDHPRLPAFPDANGRMRTDRLGVLVRPLSTAAPGDGRAGREAGLAIEHVNPGSLGQALGLRRGDVLLELDGAPVRSPEDVATVLAARAADAVIRARAIDSQGVERRLEWDPARVRPNAAPDAQPLFGDGARTRI